VENESELENESSESESGRKFRKEAEGGLISDDSEISSDEDDFEHQNNPTIQESINIIDEELTEKEDEETEEELQHRRDRKSERMWEEVEAVTNVVKKERILKFNLDKEDVDWEDGPFAKEIERGKRNIANIGGKKTKTLQVYKPYARIIMR